MSISERMTTFERVRRRPFEHVVAVLMLKSGVEVLSGNGPLDNTLPAWLNIWWAAVTLLGAAAILLGLHWRGRQVMRLAIERVGWMVAALGLLGTATIIVALDYASLARLTGTWLMGLAAALRFVDLYVEQRARQKLPQIVDEQG